MGICHPATVRLQAAAPIMSATTAAHARPTGSLRLLRRRHRLAPSCLAPILAVRPVPAGVELTVPQLDGDGRALLGDDALAALCALGWQWDEAALVRCTTHARAAAELAVRVLIEVFDVAHPADLSVLIEPTGPHPRS